MSVGMMRDGCPEGYKNTEVGVIPEDWEISTLGSLTVLMTNGFVGTATTHYAENEKGILYLQGYNVEENGFNFHGIKYVTENFHKIHMKSCLRGGDLLTVQTGEVGLTTFVSESLAGSNCHALIISRFEQKRVSPLFVSYYLNSKPGRARLRFIETGTTMKHLNVGDMLQFTIPIPPTKAEQEAIAEALSDADALIESLEQLIAKKRQIKQGAMQELLTGKRRLPGFQVKHGYKQTEVGLIPEDWEVTSLARISKEPMQNGVFYKPSLKGSGVKLINVGDLYSHIPINSVALELFNATDKECERFKVEDGDLFFTRSSIVPSGIAHCNIYRSSKHESVVFDSHVIRLRPDTNKIAPSYLFRFCASSIARNYLVSHAKRGTMSTIDQSVLGKCPVIFPSLAEQTAVATILTDMDTEITTLETKLSKARQLKQAMMQELLTGRIRLI